LLNHAFLLSEEFGLVPFTDDPMCVRLMQQKLKRMTELPGFGEFRRVFDNGTALLSMRVLEEYAAPLKFPCSEGVIIAREKLAEPLDASRRSMAALARELEESDQCGNRSTKPESRSADPAADRETAAGRHDPAAAGAVRHGRRAAIVTTLPEQKLDVLLTRHAAVEAELSQKLPAEASVKLSREFAEIDPVVGKIKAYREVQHGNITDPETIRSIAQKFAYIASDPDKSKDFNFDADRAATNLFEQARKYDEQFGSSLLYDDPTNPEWQPKRSLD